MRLPSLFTDLRESLWFIPGLSVAASAAAAFALIGVDRGASDLASQFPLVFGGGPEGARGLLSSIASSMITVAGVTFSITIVALQLASSQFSPRALRTFTRDRASQLVLGTFIGAFTYSILVLRSVRGADEGDPFVPALSVSGAIVFALFGVGMFIFFIHRIASRLQVSHIISAIADETMEELRRQHDRLARDEVRADVSDALPEAVTTTVAAEDSGYLQLVSVDGLLKVARELDLVVRVEARPGDWVHAGLPLFTVWGARDGSQLEDRLRPHASFGRQRIMQQDVSFGLREISDVAVKALSPGINDPTTARDCVLRLTDLMIEIGRREGPPRSYLDGEGRLRVILPQPSFGEMLAIAFDEIRRFGGQNASVAVEVAEGLRAIWQAVPDRRREVATAARQVAEEADRISRDEDRRAVRASLEPILAGRSSP